MGKESSPSEQKEEQLVEEKKEGQKLEEDSEVTVEDVELEKADSAKTDSDADQSSVEDVEQAQQEDEDTPDSDEEETVDDLKEKHQVELKERDDKYIRLAAEFENYKKRTTQEMQTRFKFANQSFALSLISGLDNLERALTQAQEEDENEQLKEFIRGMEMVQQQFFDALKQNNIERVMPKGELFDPNKHEAMGVVDTDEVEPDHITEVFQAGYFLHDRVIRPAMVQVAKKK